MTGTLDISILLLFDILIPLAAFEYSYKSPQACWNIYTCHIKWLEMI